MGTLRSRPPPREQETLSGSTGQVYRIWEYRRDSPKPGPPGILTPFLLRLPSRHAIFTPGLEELKRHRQTAHDDDADDHQQFNQGETF